MTHDAILLFIPCYNCADQIHRVIDKVGKAGIPGVKHVLVVDNRSRDDTVNRAKTALANAGIANWTVHLNAQNYSLGGSHKVAFAFARRHGYSHVIVLHGDDQADPGDVVPLIVSGEHRSYDALLGSRFMRQSVLEGYGPIRIVGNHIFNALFTIATGKRILDIGSGLNVIGPNVINSHDESGASDDLTFSCDFLIAIINKNRKFRFMPISWREDDQVSNARLVSQSVRILKILIAHVCRRPAPVGIGQNRSDTYYVSEIEISGGTGP